jgi:outer membrane protein TolC
MSRWHVGWVRVMTAAAFAGVAGVAWCADTNALSLAATIERVLAHNESLQIKQLEAEIGNRTYRAERGIFEPQVVGSVDRTDNRRPNNAQQRATFNSQILNTPLGTIDRLIERNTIYNGGVEVLTPTGAKVHTGYTLRQLRNNIQGTGISGPGPDLETFIGANLTQPLLKNFGPGPTMAKMRLAALASDIAFQEYRKQLMLVVSQAEGAYWDVYLTQEQERISGESVVLAGKILADNQVRQQVGRASELEVLQAEAGMALRKSKLNDARVKVVESASRLMGLLSDTSLVTNGMVRASEAPTIVAATLELQQNFQEAFNANPDYLIRQHQLTQDGIRLKYARNQRLPEVDLKASWGLNGLGRTAGESWDDVERHGFPTWSVGVEMRIPAFGGVKERNELEAAKLGRTRSLVAAKEAEVQIANALGSAASRVQTYLDSMRSQQGVVEFHQKLLAAQLARLEVGSIESRVVLETEEKLAEAKVAVIEDHVLYRKALLELDLARGSTLAARQMEITKDQLHAKTVATLKEHKWSAAELEKYQKKVVNELEKRMAY